MTADEIRAHMGRNNVNEQGLFDLARLHVLYVGEIAIQLAEIKQLIKDDALNQDPLDALSKAFARNASPQGKGRDET